MKRIPLETRLRRAGRHSDLRRLRDYAKPPTAVQPANDNLPNGFGVDLILEIRPSPDDLLDLAVQDAIAERSYGPVSPADIDRATRRRIRFKDGSIDQWLGRDGRWHSAEPHYRHERGKRRKSEAEQQKDAATHLAIPATGSFVKASVYVERGSEGEDYRRQRAARWVDAMGACNGNRRIEIDRMGVGGRHTFEEAWRNAGLYPACRLPRFMVGIARGVQFMAGKVRRNVCATEGSFVGPASGPEDALIAAMDVPRVAAALGEHRDVLERSLDGATAREIAASKGWAGKAGERKAVALQDAALAALTKIAA